MTLQWNSERSYHTWDDPGRFPDAVQGLMLAHPGFETRSAKLVLGEAPGPRIDIHQQLRALLVSKTSSTWSLMVMSGLALPKEEWPGMSSQHSKALLLFSPKVLSDSVTPWTAAHQPSLSFTISWSLLKFTSTDTVMLLNHLKGLPAHKFKGEIGFYLPKLCFPATFLRSHLVHENAYLLEKCQYKQLSLH